MKDELTYPAPPNTSSSGYVPPRPPRPTGLIVSTTVLALALAVAVVVAGVQTASLGSTREDATAAKVESDKALTAAEGEVADLEDDLSATRAKAASCANAADLLARGANGYADLWNGLDDAADEFRFIFDFYLRSIMRRTNVSNATLNAGWDALDDCEAGGTSGTGIDLA